MRTTSLRRVPVWLLLAIPAVAYLLYAWLLLGRLMPFTEGG